MTRKQYNFSGTMTMAILTACAGFLNAYTLFRWGFMPTFNTGNLTRVGTELGNLLSGNEYDAFMPFIIPVLGTVFGSFIATIISLNLTKAHQGTYEFTILIMELICFSILGILPDGSSLYFVLMLSSVLAGMQLCTFRKWGKLAHNTTIATGNMRSVGEYWALYIHRPTTESCKKALTYTVMFLTWPIGVVIGTLTTYIFLAKSIWICTFGVIVVLVSVALSPQYTRE